MVRLFNCISGQRQLIATYDWEDEDNYFRATSALQVWHPSKFVALKVNKFAEYTDLELLDTDEQYNIICERICAQFGNVKEQQEQGISITYLDPC